MTTNQMEKSVNDLLHKARFVNPSVSSGRKRSLHAGVLMLTTCRGEQFRHDQNLRKIKVRHHAHLPTRSLPPHLLTSSDSGERTPSRVSSGQVSNTAGPIPKSWRIATEEVQNKESPEWRADALSLVLSGLQANRTPVIPLAELCMGVLLHIFSEQEDFEQVLLPLLPLHLRYVLQRYTAIYAPLSVSRLNALAEDSGHINGELIVVGPNASLRRDVIALKPPDRQIPVDGSQDWEAEDPFVDSFELRTIALVSTDLSSQTILSFPRSLTRLALVNIPTPPSIFKLPILCPSIVILDLSFNSWLKDPDRSHGILGMIAWDKWNNLNILGLRGCSVHQDTLDRVNRNRWVDIQILLG